MNDARDLGDQRLLDSSVEELVHEIMLRYDLVTPELDSEHREITEAGSSYQLELHVPFSGSREVLDYQPNFFMSSGWPEGRISAAEVIVAIGPADAGVVSRADRWTAVVNSSFDMSAWT